MVGTSGTVGCWQGANPNAESAPKTREQWLAHDKMLDMVAYTIAVVATEYGIPIEWLDIDGVGANRRGVSSHNNYSYGSTALHGHKDTDHWDVPPTFPADVVLGAAKVYASTMAPTRAARSAPAARKAPAKKAAPARKVLPAKKVVRAKKAAPASSAQEVGCGQEGRQEVRAGEEDDACQGRQEGDACQGGQEGNADEGR